MLCYAITREQDDTQRKETKTKRKRKRDTEPIKKEAGVLHLKRNNDDPNSRISKKKRRNMQLVGSFRSFVLQ